jgi:hypothetical protein
MQTQHRHAREARKTPDQHCRSSYVGHVASPQAERRQQAEGSGRNAAQTEAGNTAPHEVFHSEIAERRDCCNANRNGGGCFHYSTMHSYPSARDGCLHGRHRKKNTKPGEQSIEQDSLPKTHTAESAHATQQRHDDAKQREETRCRSNQHTVRRKRPHRIYRRLHLRDELSEPRFIYRYITSAQNLK